MDKWTEKLSVWSTVQWWFSCDSQAVPDNLYQVQEHKLHQVQVDKLYQVQVHKLYSDGGDEPAVPVWRALLEQIPFTTWSSLPTYCTCHQWW